MKTITLIRHAKASQDFGYKDFDRPIVSIGIKNTIKVSSQFDLQKLPNLEVWSSSAKRTTETALLFLKNCGCDLNLIHFKLDLYTFSISELEVCIKSCSNHIENLVIFGHNNALTDFVNEFGDQYVSNIPTSGLVSIEFNSNDWTRISNGMVGWTWRDRYKMVLFCK